MNFDPEIDRFCGSLLSVIAELNPVLSRQVTKRVGRNAKLKEDKRLRKMAKAAIFFKEHNDLYLAAVQKLSRQPEWSSPRSNPKITGFYDSVYHLANLEPVSGSFGSPYTPAQKPIPE